MTTENTYDESIPGDDTMTSDAREFVDSLVASNTTLATENVQLREQVIGLGEQVAELRRQHGVVSGAYARALADLHTAHEHIDADHKSMEEAAARLVENEEALTEARASRDAVMEALQRSSDTLLTVIGERNELRRLIDLVITTVVSDDDDDDDEPKATGSDCTCGPNGFNTKCPVHRHDAMAADSGE